MKPNILPEVSLAGAPHVFDIWEKTSGNKASP